MQHIPKVAHGILLNIKATKTDGFFPDSHLSLLLHTFDYFLIFPNYYKIPCYVGLFHHFIPIDKKKRED